MYLEYTKSSRKLITETPKKKIPLGQRWAKDLNRYFLKEHLQMANKYMKRYSNTKSYEEDANQNSEMPTPTRVTMTTVGQDME